MQNLKKIIDNENNKKFLFTPGPPSLSLENINMLKPCFGRGDKEYEKIENKVLDKLKKLSGKQKIVRMQGSGSTAIELMINNFLYGNILVISTGVYSDRLLSISKDQKKVFKFIKNIETVHWSKISNVNKKYDWIVACYTETSVALKIDILELKKLAKKSKSKLMIDATASIGLEKNHNVADVLSFSSCKGLFGLTGAGFVCYDNNPRNEVSSFIQNLQNHLNKKMTGPYHTIYSLHKILENYEDFKFSVKVNKEKFIRWAKNELIYPKRNEPLLCTYVNKKIYARNKNVVLYQSRAKIDGSVVCHLGEVHLKKNQKEK